MVCPDKPRCNGEDLVMADVLQPDVTGPNVCFPASNIEFQPNLDSDQLDKMVFGCSWFAYVDVYRLQPLLCRHVITKGTTIGSKQFQ